MFVKLLFVYAMLEGRYAEVSGESIIKGVKLFLFFQGLP